MGKDLENLVEIFSCYSRFSWYLAKDMKLNLCADSDEETETAWIFGYRNRLGMRWVVAANAYIRGVTWRICCMDGRTGGLADEPVLEVQRHFSGKNPAGVERDGTGTGECGGELSGASADAVERLLRIAVP